MGFAMMESGGASGWGIKVCGQNPSSAVTHNPMDAWIYDQYTNRKSLVQGRLLAGPAT